MRGFDPWPGNGWLVPGSGLIQTFLYVHPEIWGKNSIVTHIFQLVWNHQLDVPTKWIDSLFFCLEMDCTFR